MARARRRRAVPAGLFADAPVHGPRAYGRRTRRFDHQRADTGLFPRGVRVRDPAPGDADRMLDTLALPSLIDKIRYKIPYQGFVWEVDEFLGDNAGLVVAEIELSDEGQAFERPGWIGEEVTATAGMPIPRWRVARFARGRRMPRHHAEALGEGLFRGKAFPFVPQTRRTDRVRPLSQKLSR